MAKNSNLKDFLTDVANAIREKKGTTDKINPQDFSNEIASIQNNNEVTADSAFLSIGHSTYPQLILNDILYSLQRKELYELGEIANFKDDTNLVYAPLVDIYEVSTFITVDGGNDNKEGFYQGCSNLVAVPNIDTSNLTDLSYFFYDNKKLPAIPLLSVLNCVNLDYTFYNCGKLSTIDFDLNTDNCTSFSHTFYQCSNLSRIKSLRTPKGKNFDSTFYNCNLLELPDGLDVSNATTMSNMLARNRLTLLPETFIIPTTCKDVSYLFYGCPLTEYPANINISHCTNISALFYGTDISKFPKLDITAATSKTSFLFYGTPITEVPDIVCSNSTTFTSMFEKTNIVHAVAPKGVSPTYAIDMFNSCESLETIDFDGFVPAYFERIARSSFKLRKVMNFDLSRASRANNLFASTVLTYIDLRNLGQGSLTAYNFSEASNWGVGTNEDRESLINSLLTNSYDRASNGKRACTITLSANTKALLTDEEIALITQKGFTIA